MAQIRTKQRGVIQLATGVLLAAMGALLGITGCSADEGSGGGERLGRVGQALCGSGPDCPEDSECGDWTCNKLNGGCTVTPGAKDGEKCGLRSTGLTGVCVAYACCTGCTELNRITGEVTCHQAGTAQAFCGGEGAPCQNCNSTNSCIDSKCDAGKRLCDTTPVPDKEPCLGERGACWQGKCCAGCLDGNDNCVAGNTVAQCGLSSTNNALVGCKSCDDGNVCNTDSCQSGVCAAPAPKAGACNDNNACTTNDTCGGGQCVGGPAPNCNDNNPCTIDTCDAVTGCKHTPVEAGTSCDDATVCNGVAKCELGANGIFCKAGTAPDCDDDNVCTNDTCDPVTGCKHANNTADCSDGSLCTLVDKCSGGVCVGSGAPNCNDNEPCTTDSCVAATGCKNAPKVDDTACDDGNGCTMGDKCGGGKCAGVGQSCDDMNACTKNSCTVMNGCSNPNEAGGTPCTFDKCHQNSTCLAGKCEAGVEIDCDDNNVCTTDSCDPLTGCKHVNINGGDCSDDNKCTTADTCSAGACVGTPAVCAPVDDCHLAGTCDAETGDCTAPRAPDETECDGGDGSCKLGKCEPNSTGTAGAGSGGETGVAGDGPGGTNGAGGSVVAMGGEPSTPAGGEGNEPGAGGTPGEPGGGKGASSNGGTDTHSGGEGIDPEHVFVRNPGGCSCSVPSSQGSKALWLVALGLVAASARRRRSSGSVKSGSRG